MDTKESIVEFERIAKEWKRATRELSRVIKNAGKHTAEEMNAARKQLEEVTSLIRWQTQRTARGLEDDAVHTIRATPLLSSHPLYKGKYPPACRATPLPVVLSPAHTVRATTPLPCQCARCIKARAEHGG